MNIIRIPRRTHHHQFDLEILLVGARATAKSHVTF